MIGELRRIENILWQHDVLRKALWIQSTSRLVNPASSSDKNVCKGKKMARRSEDVLCRLVTRSWFDAATTGTGV